VTGRRRSVGSDDRSHWFPAYIGLGSNLHGPARQLENTFELLGDIRDTHLIKRSSLYRSAPFGGVEQPDFINAAASLLTQLSAEDLLLELQRIENERGRERGEVRWGPRVLDLDLLVYSSQIIDEPGLSVPHPGIGERNFVLLPLREIAPELNIPGLGRVSQVDADSIEPRISRIG
jgi:2-amino-4-hydroxy-6-hydroxymethyldihydropteridine diphosphokinase